MKKLQRCDFLRCIQGLIRGYYLALIPTCNRTSFIFCRNFLISTLSLSLSRICSKYIRCISYHKEDIQSFSIISFRTICCTFKMKIIGASAILALFTLEFWLVSASLETRQVPVAKYILTGFSSTGTPYPSYNISVPEDGVTRPISASSPAISFFSPKSLKAPLQ